MGLTNFLGGAVKKVNAQIAAQALSFNAQTSVYGRVLPLVYGQTRLAGNLTWFGDFQAIPHVSSTGGGGGKGGGQPQSQGQVTYTYKAALEIAICEGPIDGIGAVWADKQQGTAAGFGFGTFLGSYPQSPWGYLSTYHPGQALNYAGVAYLAAASYALTSSATLQNHSFEVQGRYRYNPGSGIVDANPKDIVTDLLTNPNYGANFPAARLGDLSSYSQFCLASDLLLSPLLDEQRAARDWLAELARLTNSAFVWSGDRLKLIPYGDASITGNGQTFTPDLTPLYDLSDVDFIAGPGEEPVRCTRSSPADAYNQLQVEWVNRSNQYNNEIAEAKDQANIDAHGLRQASIEQAHPVTRASVAQSVAQFLLQRGLYIRNTYEFKLGWKYCLLEPMDLVIITDAALGLAQQLVRIIAIEEDEHGTLSVTAEEMPVGTASSAVYGSQSSAGYQGNFNADPGGVNTPIFFGAPVEIADTGLEVWAVLSGGPLWGGADAYLSTDGSTYQFSGRIQGGARQGVLQSALTSGSDPDTVNVLHVDLSQSRGQLISGTQADADANHTLCYVDGEFISFQTATLTASYKYDLSYLRRGQYASAISAHGAGASFARLDGGIFHYPYTKAQIGRTLYAKFVSFNIYGGGTQDIASVTAYPFAVPGPPLPANVTGFGAQQNGAAVVFKWNQIGSLALKGYDIRYGAIGTSDWNAMIPLTESARGTEMTNAAVPPGAWVFACRARDIADQLSPGLALVTLTVVNNQVIVANPQQAPDWLGTVTGFFRHWSGVLVPLGTRTCNSYGWEVFDQYIPDATPAPTYDAPIIDTGFDDTLRVSAQVNAALGPLQAGAAAAGFQLDSRLNGGAYGGFQAWTVGTVAARFFKARLAMDCLQGLGYVSGFRPVIDSAGKTLNFNALAIPAGGYALGFGAQFHSLPGIQVTPLGNAALIGTADSVTTIGCTLHLFDRTGADVGGVANIQVAGP